jgi:hypothetical protein
VISDIERGQLAGLSFESFERVARTLDAVVDVRLRWHGEQLDRLLDSAHASLVERLVSRLRGFGWTIAVEATFSVYGERGSIDVLGYHARTAALLVVEIKSVIPDAQELLAGLDRKARLARRLAQDRGWQPTVVSRLLVVGDSTTTRRRVAMLEATFAAVLPARSTSVRRWLRHPDGPLDGVLFLPYAATRDVRRTTTGRQRVRGRVRAVVRAN